MSKEEMKKELIDKVSILYRHQNDIANKIKREIFELEDKLQDENISHKNYLRFQNDLTYLKEKYQKEINIVYGMSLAREELF